MSTAVSRKRSTLPTRIVDSLHLTEFATQAAQLPTTPKTSTPAMKYESRPAALWSTSMRHLTATLPMQSCGAALLVLPHS